MSENKNLKVATTTAPTTPEAAKTDKKAEKKPAVHTSREEKKPKWTLERCQAYARRFPNEGVWSASSPSSYKAAVAHGWVAACLKQQGRTAHAPPLKKAA